MERTAARNILRGRVLFYPIDTKKFPCPICTAALTEKERLLDCEDCDVSFTVQSVWPELPIVDPYLQLILQ